MWKAGLMRILKEFWKLSPLVVILVLYVRYFGDNAQLELGLYIMTVLLMVLVILQVVRKFMFPTFSVEAHMKSAKDDMNIASAFVVSSYFAFLCMFLWLVAMFLLANVRPPV